MKDTPLVKFIPNCIPFPSGVFFISSLVEISVTLFPAFSWSFVQTVEMASSRSVKFS